MAACGICELEQDGEEKACQCSGADLDLYRAAAADLAVFPGSALPAVGLVNAGRARALRMDLLHGELHQAEASFLEILRGLRGHGKAERDAAAHYFDRLAALNDAQARPEDARRMRNRAEASRKDPTQLARKSEAVLEGREHAMTMELKRIQDGGDKPDLELRRQVQLELDRSLAAQERRSKVLKVGAFGMAGLMGGLVLGVNLLLTGLVGAGLGAAWSLKR
jgi:hypothetical protein